jgi:hypothetical protein
LPDRKSCNMRALLQPAEKLTGQEPCNKGTALAGPV